MKKYKKALITISLFLTFLVPPVVYAQNATGEGESVLQKIKEKVETIRQNPKAYIGVVTDKTESSLQIKDTEGKIQQLSISNSVTIVKTGKTNTEIKFTDIAIGDYIVSMGLLGSNNVLDAKRILLSSPIEDPKRKIVLGKVTTIKNKEITISESVDSDGTYAFPKRWKGPDIKDLKEGMTVVVVSIPDTGKETVRTIKIINTNPSPTPSTDVNQNSKQ